jgi:MFS transporter, CP family, cyanate transporter
MSSEDAPPVRDRRAVTAVAGAAIVLVALNLRPAVPSFGALLREVQEATGMSTTLAGVLTTLPPICFGVFGLLGGWLARRMGTARSALLGMALISGGLAARVLTDRPGLIVLLTVPALAGMAIGNVLLPVAVKRWFPRHIGRATGVYSLSLSLGTAAAAAVSVPIAQAAGSWRAGLGVWALTPLLALPPWWWLRRREVDASAAGAGEAPVEPGRSMPAPVPPSSSASGALHRNPKVWAFAGFFGAQSLAAYALFGWLPTIYRDAGIPSETAGLLLALVIVIGAPISLVLPELAAKRDDQRHLVLGLATSAAAAYVGLWLAPSGAPWLWATLLGIGMGSFPLVLLLIGLRASTAQGTAQLSGLTQGSGYLIAAAGPFAIGALNDATGGWSLPLLVLLALLVPQTWCGLVIAKPGAVDVPLR